MKYLLPALGVAALAATSVVAQDISAPPSYGSITLDSGFLPDPHNVQMRAGGNLSASSNINSSCRGYIASAPDYNVYYTAGALDLFFSATSDTDTTIIVNDARGNWYCDDDGGEGAFNPGVHIERPASGLYNVWVGTYSSSGGFPATTLHVSEIGFGPRPVGEVRGGPDYTLPANFGSRTVNNGFVPDPINVGISAGGNLDVSNYIDGCWGYVSAAPDYEITYNAGSTFDLYLSATSDRDTVILVNAPDGSWHCNDDGAEGLNPGLMFENPQSGVYDIWVGTYSSSAGTPPATLHISELNFGGEPAFDNNVLDFSLPSNYGSVSLRSGFTPDPYNVEIFAGGNVDVRENGPDGCWGYTTAAPDFELSYTAGNAFDLYLSATSDRDTVIIVNAPDGSWHCNDDGSEGLNPGLMFENPQSGVYDIWVGTYSSSAGTPAATLHISELSFGY